MNQPKFQMGTGTWAWGDHLIWNFGQNYSEQDLYEVFLRAIEDQIPFFFTSENFAEGSSETFLGKFNQKAPGQAHFSTKFVPRFWRIDRNSFQRALKNSLKRLNCPQIDIYQTYPLQGIMSYDLLAECFADAMEKNLIHFIGVSNFSKEQIEIFEEDLNHLGLRISFLETSYSLLDRSIESNGIQKICRQLGIQILAQSPLAMGLLTGKYDEENLPEGSRRILMEPFLYSNLPVLLRHLKKIGSDHGGKNCSQVALNWIIQKKIIPIPGSKNLKQIIENDQAAGWEITPEEIQELDNFSELIVS